MSIFDGASRPMRAAGLGLIAVAVVATALGGVSLVTGDDTTDTAATGSTGPAPGEDGGDNGDGPSQAPGDDGRGTGDGSPDDRTTDDGTADDGSGEGDSGRDTGDGTGGDTDAGQGGTDGNPGHDDRQVGVEETAVRVYNNSDISGLASDAGDDLRARGWNVVEIANYSDGIIPDSTVYFRPGTGEERLAHALGEDFGMRAEPRFDGISDASPGIIVIVTRDYEGPVDPK